MYSLTVYSELITFPCINLICLIYNHRSPYIYIYIYMSYCQYSFCTMPVVIYWQVLYLLWSTYGILNKWLWLWLWLCLLHMFECTVAVILTCRIWISGNMCNFWKVRRVKMYRTLGSNNYLNSRNTWDSCGSGSRVVVLVVVVVVIVVVVVVVAAANVVVVVVCFWYLNKKVICIICQRIPVGDS